MTRFRLPKSKILRGYDSFSRVLAGSSALSSPPIRLFVRLDDRNPQDARFGFAVARAIQPAARRNRIRRHMREAFRLESAGHLEHPRWRGTESVFMYVGPAGKRESFEAIRSSVRQLIQKAEIQKK